MYSAVHVGVVLLVVPIERLEDRARLLAGRRAVEIDERLAVDLLPEDGEVLPHPLDIEPRWHLAQRSHAASFSPSNAGSFAVTRSRTRARRGPSGTRFTISLANA